MKEIFNRRSVRRFTQEPIAEAQLTLLLRAAMRAPSAGNSQPWQFVVLRQRANLAKVTEYHPYAQMLHEAPCAIVVCGDNALQKFEAPYWVQDCSAAIQNILLEATHLGLGGVWLGVYPEPGRVENLQKQLNLPATVTPLGIVALGHPAEVPAPIDTYKPERVHFEQWQNTAGA